jgi:hypothetical protein
LFGTNGRQYQLKIEKEMFEVFQQNQPDNKALFGIISLLAALNHHILCNFISRLIANLNERMFLISTISKTSGGKIIEK